MLRRNGMFPLGVEVLINISGFIAEFARLEINSPKTEG